MPFAGNHEGDIGLETPSGPMCKFDVENGEVKSAEDIFAGGVQFFLNAVADGDAALAERLTRKNMQSLAYWQAHRFPALEGVTATDEEFAACMAKLAA